MASTNLKELGVSSPEQFSYQPRDASLRGSQAVETYDCLRRSDPTGKAMYEVLTLPLRKAKWFIVPGGEKTPADVEAAKFVETCFKDMDKPFADWISDICMMFSQGWVQFWMVLKRRTEKNSKYPDGKVGFGKMEYVNHRALMDWSYDDLGNVTASNVMTQAGGTVEVPLDGSLLFRTTPEGGVPTGISIFEATIRTWKYRLRLEQAEGVGLTRRWKGFPTITLPDGATTETEKGKDSDEVKARNMLEALHDDRMMGALLPEGWLLDFGGPKGVIGAEMGETIIRKDAEMARAILAHFIMLGLRAVGTQALAETLLDLFIVSAEAFQQVIEDVVNFYAMPILFKHNAMAITGYPQLTFASPRTQDLRATGAFINLIAKAGAFTADEATENFLRGLVPNMPQIVDGVYDDEGDDEATGGVPDDSDSIGDNTGEDIAQTDRPKEEANQEEYAQRGYPFAGVPFSERALLQQERAASSPLVLYNEISDRNAAKQRINLREWSEALARTLTTSSVTGIDTLRDMLSAAVLEGLRTFRTEAVESITTGFRAGYSEDVLQPEALQILADEILLSDSYIGWLPGGELRLLNPDNKSTLWGDIDTELHTQAPVIFDALISEDMEQAALLTTSAVKAVTNSYARGELYSGHVRRATWQGVINSVNQYDTPVTWNVDSVAQHCGTCSQLEGIYPSIVALLSVSQGVLPGFGTECDGHCHCNLTFMLDGDWIVP